MSQGVWLEVGRVRIQKRRVSIQVVGDKRDDEPDWWKVETKATSAKEGQPTFNAIADGLDKADRVVIARLSPKAGRLTCSAIRIQTA